MVPSDAVWIYHLALEIFPLFLERFPPRRSGNTMSAGPDTLHSQYGIRNDAGNQYPGNQVNSRPIKPVELIMLKSAPVRLNNHCRLKDWNLCLVGRPSSQLPLARTVPIHE